MLKRLICWFAEHVVPDEWDESRHDPHVTCTRCGKTFDAAEQERVKFENQVFSP
jgi:Fe2+ or Zn2+ uptake regulation protein